MTVLAAKHSVMTVYSHPEDVYSHRCRIVLAEKGITVDIHDIDSETTEQDLTELNPYGSVPTLVDRELILYNSLIIMEYLDERFPHPPLMPAYPVARSQTRLMMHRIDKDWYSLLRALDEGRPDEQKRSGKLLVESLLSVVAVFQDKPFFLSEEFSLVDCCLAPLLWRLPYFNITLPKAAECIEEYAERMFAREAFQASLSPAERGMRVS